MLASCVPPPAAARCTPSIIRVPVPCRALQSARLCVVPIDLDRPATWPPELHTTAERLWAGAQRRVDLDGSMDQLREVVAPDAVDEAIGGEELLVFHATRLLPHETELVLRDGVQPASEQWQRKRLLLGAEHQPGVLQETVIEELVAHGPLRWQGEPGSGRPRALRSRPIICRRRVLRL